MSYILKEEVMKILNSYIDEEYPDPTSGATLNMIDEIKALPFINTTSDNISREEAKKILTDLAQEFSDDDKKVWILAEAHGKIDNLPSIDNSQIRELIQKKRKDAWNKHNSTNGQMVYFHEGEMNACEEILSEIESLT